jgi:hypothetical protein
VIAAARRLLMSAIVAALLACPATAAAAPPAHDFWANARPAALDDNDVRANTEATEALSSGGGQEPLTPFGDGFCNNGQFDDTSPTGIDMVHTVWYAVTGNGRPVTIDLRGSTIDTLVAVYRGDTTPSGATFETCGDNISSTNVDSEVLFNTDPGEIYLVQIGSRRCTEPCGQGSIDFIAWSSSVGDFRAEALPLTTAAAVPGDTAGASEEVDEDVDCNGVPFSRTFWLRYRAPGPGTATFTAGGTFDTVLAVYRGSQQLGCDDDPSQVVTHVTAGDYLIQVGAVGIAPNAPYGTFNARVTFTADPPPPKPDSDGDGVTNDVDKCPAQNASARDANRDGCLDADPDPDRDGVPVGTDKCPTQNAGARDKNRDGCLDPVPRKRISADVSLRATPTAAGIRIRSLRVQAPKGSKVTVRCGRGCRFARRASATGKARAMAAKTVTVKKLAGRTFRAGEKIRIYVTRKGRIGAYIQYTVRRGGFKRVNRCLNPGTMKPRKRCR